MCGLVGIAGAPSVALDKAFRTMLILDTIRGEHSTGVLLVDLNNEYSIHKAVGDPFQLFDSRRYESDFRSTNNLLIGHNRYATAGAVNKVNAHPFECNNLVGAHNGTLTTQYKLDDNRFFDVDSENLYHHMSIHGVKETTPLLGGAYALTWWDKEDGTLNFLRNKERPLYYAFTKDGKNVLWASEAWMLTVAETKANIKLGKVECVEPIKHYSMVIPLGGTAEYPKLDGFATVVVEEYKAPKSQERTNLRNIGNGFGKRKQDVIESTKTYGGRTTFDFVVNKQDPRKKNVLLVTLKDFPFVRAQFNCLHSSKKFKNYIEDAGFVYTGEIKRVIRKSSTPLVVFDAKSIKEAVAFDSSDVVDVNGTLVDNQEFLDITAKGCVSCGDVPSFDEAEELTWVNDTTHVCAFCMMDERVSSHVRNGNI